MVSEDSEALQVRLLDGGLLRYGGEVDPEYYALRFSVTLDQIITALEALAAKGLVEVEVRWQCTACGEETTVREDVCGVCGSKKSDTSQQKRYVRSSKPPQRDPAAVFLIHGMNTLGDWQESFAWKIQLMYGYSLPVFVFKFGKDLTAPLMRFVQNRRTIQLGHAVRQACIDLRASGRSNRCDVVAHSFGTLLFAQLLTNRDFDDLNFGRIVLSGSIVPEDFGWRAFLEAGRVESVLNHRAGRDVWVRVAPWFFPGVGASGFSGFDDKATHEYVSSGFRHSDFFSASHFDSVIKQTWAAFLNNELGFGESHEASAAFRPNARPKAANRKHWIGRMILILTVGSLIVLMLLLLSPIGKAADVLLDNIGL